MPDIHTDNITIIALYKFAPFPRYVKEQKPLKAFMEQHHIFGTILLAPEGINGTVSGEQKDIDALIAYLRKIDGFDDISYKVSHFDARPFERVKVKCKKELIGMGVQVDPRETVGTYVKPEDWNALISDPDVVNVDARNDYEFFMGHFKGATDPKTRKFKQIVDYTEEQLDPKKHKKIATYCTGGIRCEKYTSYLLEQGFEEVYHLDGGILAYLEQVPEEESLWEGGCYVFDERIAVGQNLAPIEGMGACEACGHPLTTKDRNHPEHIPGKQCRFCDTAIPSNSDERPDPERYKDVS